MHGLPKNIENDIYCFNILICLSENIKDEDTKLQSLCIHRSIGYLVTMWDM